MINFLKAQIFALIFLVVLMVIIIIRMPVSSTETIELQKNVKAYYFANIEKGSDNFFVSTSNDPYIVIPEIKKVKPYRSFVNINVNYLSRQCGASLDEPASFIQVFWKSADEAFSEDKSDTAPISLGRDNYLIPLHSLSMISESSVSYGNLLLRLDIVNKQNCKFRINKIIFGAFR